MTREETIKWVLEQQMPQVKEVDENKAVVYDQFVLLTHETYEDIKKQLEILEIFRKRLYQCVDVKSNTLNYTLDTLSSNEYCKVKGWLEQ